MMKKPKVLCVYSAKGGIGKTIITLSLAGTFSNIMRKVLIIDWDIFNGDIAVSLDRKAKKTVYNLYEDLKNNEYHDINEYIVEYNKYISFIAAPKDPREALKMDFNYLDRIINECSNDYEAIIIDTTHSYIEANIKALKSSDQVLFITTNNPLDLKNSRNILTVLKEEGIKNIKILLNNSIHPHNDYFVLYDIKSIIDNHIDYIISSNFHYRDIDIITVNGEILTIKSQKWTDYKIFTLIVESLLK